MSKNCFVSFHHDRDQSYLEKFREFNSGETVVDHSLKSDIGHLDEDEIYQIIRKKMRNCSVTIVLIGERTGHRKWVDLELWASLRPYKHKTDPLKSFKPNGLLAVFLPKIKKYSIPKRLQDNLESGYAVKMHWNFLKRDLDKRINEAFEKRNTPELIDNSRERMSSNDWELLGFRF